MRLRRAKRTECTWPHAILTVESEQRLTKVIIGYRRWIRAQARRIAHRDRYLRHELEQVALLELWTRGWRELENESTAAVQSALVGAMKNARKRERRNMGGDRRIRVRGLNH